MKLCTQHIVSLIQFKILLTITILLLAILTYGQQNSCSDSSYRIKYIFENNGAALFNNPDTSGINIFTGELIPINPTTGIALFKTTWGDSLIWAKKILMNGTSRNSFNLSDGSILCTGFFGPPANSELLLCRINANGNVIWVKHYKLRQNHLNYQNVSFNSIKNILISNNAIYLNAVMYFNSSFVNNYYNIISKLDLNGNIIWSKSFKQNTPKSGQLSDAPVFYNNTILFAANISEQPAGIFTKAYSVITKLNDIDGSIVESNAYNTNTDSILIRTTLMNINPDVSFSLTGNIAVKTFSGSFGLTDIIFNSRIDSNLNVVHNFYYKNNISIDAQDIYFDFNNQGQHGILAKSTWNPFDKYFVTFGKNDEVQRSRKFTTPNINSSVYRTSLNLDNKQNLHFLNHYPQAGKIVTEYARISNLAPNGTLGCFGKDTSVFTRYPFTLTKEPFVWDNIQNDVITSNDVPYTEDTAIVTKELVCKIVSRCDSVHINGPAAACVGVPVRYTVSKNSGCFKNLDWSIDTAFATIVNLEGDSAITINFKKTFNGYIHAALTDCVVKDSFLVKAVVPKMPPLIKRTDSLLCPGKTLVLAANNGYTNYLWQGSVAAQQFTVNAIGVYTVTALDSCGLLKTDSIRVTLADTSLIVPVTQTICLFDTAFITLPNDVNNITWQPTTNSLLTNKTLLFYPPQTTLYTITAERSPNCSILKTSTVVIKTCPQTVFIPNSFTPNNDSKNDIFKPAISQPLALYRLQIFNRYGQTIFESNNQQSGWDGTYKGKQQPMGGYIYQCSYKFNGGVQKMVKGYFILIR